MKKYVFMPLIILAAALILAPCAFATLGEGSSRVFDYATLFTADEASALQAKLDELRIAYNMDFLVLTSDESYTDDSHAYANDFFDYNGFGVGDDRDGFLFFIDMLNRVPTISTRGLMIRYVTSDRLDALLEVGYDDLAAGSYGGAAMATLNALERYLADGIPSDQYNIDEYGSVDYYYESAEPAGRNWAAIAIIGAVAGVVAGFIYYFANKRSYSLKGSQYRYDYRANSEAEITERSDSYIRTSVTKTPKAPPPDSRGGGSSSSTRTSSSGATHGGGSGRKF